MKATQTGPNELTLADGKKLVFPGPIRSATTELDSIVVRYGRPGESRDRVWGYDANGSYKWSGQVSPLASLHVTGDRRRVTLPGGAEVKLPAELASFTQVEPALSVIVFDRNLGDPYNVVAYRSDGAQAWRIGERDGRPPGPFDSAEVDEDGTLHTYASARGFAAIVAPQTGAILTTTPYR